MLSDLLKTKHIFFGINAKNKKHLFLELSAKSELFNKLIKAGVCREQARGVLPQNLYTQYYGTVNLHNLLKFVSNLF